jgi:hypothetical protein
MASSRYKISYVVEGSHYAGDLVDSDHRPSPGDTVMLDGKPYVVTYVEEVMRPVGDFGLIHVVCRPAGR